ncbi:nucleoside deaminase [Anaerosinus massiliensis]|uniref:nucleoside deaminase n=1 Tax=Massilibacillus massiliensis TaxID=1806837 RepID=UPI000AF634C8|nr:nucleoside deaminase [Massilibacillus massiliensis]
MKHEDFMKIAALESQHNLAENNGGPFGAVIVKNGTIVSKGHNEVLKNNDPTCHAEVQAIRQACQNLKTYDLTDCVLYTSCYPCPMCLSAAIWANIKTIYYGNTAKDAADIGFRDDFIYHFIEHKCSNENVLKLLPLGRSFTIQTFEKFKQKIDKTIY